MLDLSIIIKCKEDWRIIDCIKSIDEDVEIIVSMTQFPEMEEMLNNLNVKCVIGPSGNIGRGTNIGIQVSTKSHFVIMDSDSVFSPGAIRLLFNALRNGNLVVKPKILYQTNQKIYGSGIVAEYRDFINNHTIIRALTPGIGLSRNLENQLGYFFHDKVPYTEDAELNSRLSRNNIPITFIPDAIVYHTPVTMAYDLGSAYRLGFGERLGVEFANRFPKENIRNYFKRLIRGEQVRYFRDVKRCKGWIVAFYMVLWSVYYYFGYYYQQITGKYSRRILEGLNNNPN
jgi:hypothetical protein